MKQLGPLWANTCYEFESTNHVLKKLIHGTRKVDMQVQLNVLLTHNAYISLS